MSKLKKLMISLFIIFNLMAMIRVHLPLQNRSISTIYKPIDFYLSFFSIYQDWMMFAPDPMRNSVHIKAEVEFDDGSRAHYIFPQNKNLNIFQKYAYGEKFRKIVSDGIRKDSNSFLWRDTAKFVLRKLKDDNYYKIPLRVHLIRFWDEVPNLNKEFRLHSFSSKKFNQFRFYTYEVL